jgi:hypothetical protein
MKRLPLSGLGYLSILREAQNTLVAGAGGDPMESTGRLPAPTRGFSNRLAYL